MKLVPIKHKAIIKPPFKNDVADLIDWVKPVTVLAYTSEGIIGGVLVSQNVVAVTEGCEDYQIKVMIPNGHIVKAVKSDYEASNFYLRFYIVSEKTEWFGLPFRGDDLRGQSFLFSYHPKGYVYRFEPIADIDSKSVEKFQATKSLIIDTVGVQNSLPVVDRYGYFIGLSIGASEGETIVQVFNMSNSPL